MKITSKRLHLMSTAFFQAASSEEKMLVRINPGEVVKIIEENFDVYSRAGVMSYTQNVYPA
jgi:hypothetical protein